MDKRTPFNPPPLPPDIDFHDKKLVSLLLDARTALGELNGFSYSVPNPYLFISPSIIRESVESSQIENINTTVELAFQGFLFPAEEQRPPDKEVLRYRDAILWGHENLGKLPIGHRLICGIFEKLMPSYPGEYRTGPNSIQNSKTGEILYTPPSPERVTEYMAAWERFQNQPPGKLDPLIKAALLHYQFEAIHPFPDGNGRCGRILLVLSLAQDGLLKLPVLYLSAFINRNRTEYYRLLNGVTERGEWMEWLSFLVSGMVEQGRAATQTLKKVADLYQRQRDRIRNLLGGSSLIETGEQIFKTPILSPVHLGKAIGIHYTTASRTLKALEKAGILEHMVMGKYQLYIHRELIEVING